MTLLTPYKENDESCEVNFKRLEPEDKDEANRFLVTGKKRDYQKQ